MYKVIDLFAGAGGLSYGFEKTEKFKIIAAAEINKNARITYNKNHPNTQLYSDVRKIDYKKMEKDIGKIDCVIGGPPCQGFSNANRQHSTIVNMNNRLVKEYVRAILELKPKVFVMENVAMLKSDVHRFILDENDLNNPVISNFELKDDYLELLPDYIKFPHAIEFIQNHENIEKYKWDTRRYKLFSLLYRYRINQDKFKSTVEKHKNQILKEIRSIEDAVILDDYIKTRECYMANRLNEFIVKENSISIEDLISAIETPLFIQRMLGKMDELLFNHIHIFEYLKLSNGAIVAAVKSYSVLEYITKLLENDYNITPNILNAANYGAPQKRTRFILVGILKTLNTKYVAPKIEYEEENYRTVRMAISDLETESVSTDISAEPIILKPVTELSSLAADLRGPILYNHVMTATREEAKKRFKVLKEGQNFHDLDSTLKTTYSNIPRTQNTIYMRLIYDKPSGTVVNVRKSMWIHPKEDRALTIREAARLQTFPDKYIFYGTKDSQYQQVGNAVPPYLAFAIAKSLLNVIDK